MKLSVPFKAIKDNLLMNTRGEVWAYYYLEAESISNTDSEGLAQHKTKLALLFDRLVDFEDFELRLYNRDLDLVNRYKELTPDLADDLGDTPFEMLANELEAINASGVSQTVERFVVGIKLRNQYEGKVIRSAQSAFSGSIDGIASLFGYEKPFDDKTFKEYQLSEKSAYDAISYLDHSRRLSASELSHLIRNCFIQGQKHDFRKVGQTQDVFKLSDTVIDDGTHAGFIRLINDDSEQHVAKLVMSTTPENITGFYFFRILQNLNFPVDVVLSAHVYSREGAFGLEGKASSSLKQAKVSAKERFETEDFTSSKDSKQVEIAELLNDHVSEKKNFFTTLVTLTISASTIDLLKERVDLLIDGFKDMEIEIVKPLGEQKRLFYYDLPSSDITQNKYWTQLLTSQGIAEFLFAVDQQVGNTVGFYIGRGATSASVNSTQEALNSSRRLVFFNPLVANEILDGSTKTTSPNIYITGKTGTGKSYLTKLLMKIVQMFKADVIYFDPKQEMRKWYSGVMQDEEFKREYPAEFSLLSSINFVTLDVSVRENYGVLDPFIVIDVSNKKDAIKSNEELLKATVQEIFKQIYRDYGSLVAETYLDIAIDEVIQKRKNGEIVGMLDVIEALSNSEDVDVQNLAKFLSGKVTRSALSLVFSHGESAGLKLTNRITILETAGLSLPKYDTLKKDYTEFEVASMIVMTVLGVFCRKFATSDYSRKTVEIFDEAWTFTSSKIGSSIFNEMARIGRSANNTLIPVTQSVNDIASGNFGVLFAFDNDKERPEILKHLGLDPSPENIEVLENFVMGQCFMQDIYGRTEKITVDETSVGMKQAYQTVNAGASAEAERAFR